MRRVAVALAGAVLCATAVHGQTPAVPSARTLAGTVYDSLLTGGPLADAEIWVEGTTLSARTGRDGRFRLDSLPAGRLRVTFSHPTLEALRIGAPVLTLDSLPTRDVTLATPSAATVHRALCPAGEAKTGLLLGAVRRGAGGAPTGGVRVTAEWVVWTLGGATGVRRDARTVSDTTGADGMYRLCAVPTDVPVQLRAESGDGAVAVADVAVGQEGRPLAFRDVALPVADTPVALALTDTTAATAAGRAGRAIVVGEVRSETGAPMADVDVSAPGVPGTASARTDAAGRFALGGLPSGPVVLEARAIGYRAARARLSLGAGGTTRAALTLSNPVVVLATAEVRGRRATPAAVLDGFERRRRAGLGRFVTPEMIERRRAIQTTSLLADLPGVRLLPASEIGGRQLLVLNRGSGSVYGDACTPTLYLDGVRVGADGVASLDDLIAPQQVHGAEVYQTLAGVPAEYAPSGVTGCGVILIWTKRAVR